MNDTIDLPQPILSFEEVSLSFKGLPVVRGVSFSLREGEVVLLNGPSGTGKSSLMRMILGFVHPSSGRVRYRGEEVGAETAWNVRREVAYVAQDTDIGDGIVQELIDTVLSYQVNAEHLTQTAQEDHLNDLLSIFGLGREILSQDFRELSGGERQRVVTILGLMLGREIFLLDEITASLDVNLKQRVADYFLGHPEWTLLVISHDREWMRPGVRVIDMVAYRGKV